jgi:hypothetical protein
MFQKFFYLVKHTRLQNQQRCSSKCSAQELTWTRSCDFRIYNYTGSMVLGWSVLHQGKIMFIPKTSFPIGCVVKIYSADIVTRDRGIGS